MTVVIDLDPLRRLGQFERIGQLAEQFALGGGLGHAPLKRFHGIALRLLDELAPVAALGTFECDLSAGAVAQSLRQQGCIAKFPVDQDPARGRHVLVKLDKEARQHLGLRHVIGMGGKKGAMAPVLAAADEKGLDAHGPGLASQSEDVGIAQPLGMHRLAALDVGQRPEAVAIDRRQLVIPRIRRRSHGRREARLHIGRLAGEERLGVGDQLGIFLAADAVDAGRRAALDLIEQARPRAVGEEAVGTAP